MKRPVVFLLLSVLLTCLIRLPVSGGPGEGSSGAPAAGGIEPPAWECPIAAGIYYPSDGKVPDHPVRYYRVRCWPGCHSGSSYGLYPRDALEDRPIFPTSTIDGHTGKAAVAE